MYLVLFSVFFWGGQTYIFSAFCVHTTLACWNLKCWIWLRTGALWTLFSLNPILLVEASAESLELHRMHHRSEFLPFYFLMLLSWILFGWTVEVKPCGTWVGGMSETFLKSIWPMYWIVCFAVNKILPLYFIHLLLTFCVNICCVCMHSFLAYW